MARIKIVLKSQLCACQCGGMTKPGSQYIRGHNSRKFLKPEPKLCECQCGEITNPGRRFIFGHNRRKSKSESQLCACGKCGLMTKPGNKFVLGHNRRTKPIIILGHHLCGCNKCSIMVPSNRKYAKNHQRIGIKNTKQSLDLMSESANQRWKDPTERERAKNGSLNFAKNRSDEEKIKQRKRQKDAMNRPEVKEKQSKKTKANWQNPGYVKKQMKARNVKQNKLEKQSENIFQRLFPNEYKFTGYGDVIIGGKCPDFTNINGQKKLIEVYGDYWHHNDDPQDRIDHFREYGWDCLVIWEHEIYGNEELLEAKLIEFHNRLNLSHEQGDG